ncbi:MAG: hypothetical protein HYR85_08130 [Planctomycetes bacterium]|nr:hypothetical protein [Planctomycetota bacterium]MBI3843245.1 hypothetical protein [Planctomycetota bacterium]
MTALELLTTLRTLGAKVQVAEGKLRVVARRDLVTDEHRASLAARKDEILRLLADEHESAAEPGASPSPSEIVANGSAPFSPAVTQHDHVDDRCPCCRGGQPVGLSWWSRPRSEGPITIADLALVGQRLADDDRRRAALLGIDPLPARPVRWPEPWRSQFDERVRTMVLESHLDEAEAARKVERFVREWQRAEAAGVDGARIIGRVPAPSTEMRAELPARVADWPPDYRRAFDECVNVAIVGRTPETEREAEIVVRRWHRNHDMETNHEH